MQPRIIALVTAFIATLPLASWLEGNIGMACASGPCIVPVGFGLAGLSSVIAIGASLVLRDAIHEIGGAGVAIVAIAIGGILSAMFAAPVLVVASVLAFVLAELADFAIYAGLRKRSFMLAVLFSGVAGSVVHSAVFHGLAFGSLMSITGPIVGKAWMSLLVLPFLPFKLRATR